MHLAISFVTHFSVFFLALFLFFLFFEKRLGWLIWLILALEKEHVHTIFSAKLTCFVPYSQYDPPIEDIFVRILCTVL